MTLLENEDIIFLLANFLTHLELCRISETKKSINNLCRKPHVWKAMIDYKIALIQLKDRKRVPDWTKKTSEILAASSYLGLFQSLRDFQVPLVGWWQRVPQPYSIRDYSGELLTISVLSVLTSERVFCTFYDNQTRGNGISCRRCVIAYHENARVGALRTQESTDDQDDGFYVCYTNGKLLLRKTSSSGGDIVRYYERISAHCSLNCRIEDVSEKLLECLGFCTAIYSSHGRELLSVSITTGNENISMIEGLKVIGDKNVPAGRLSFRVMLNEEVDVDGAIGSDDRLAFCSISKEEFMMVDLALRRPHIWKWYRASGQINCIQGVWNPEWVGASFIVYHAPLEPQKTIFSILWDDMDHEFRHITDFSRFGNIAMPEWEANISSES